MSLMTRFSNGWNIAMNSLRVLNANKQLLIFPFLSGISMIVILGSFVTVLLSGYGWDAESFLDESSSSSGPLYLFLFYLVNYFVVVFFNTALVHCTRLYFEGEEVSIEKGLRFALSRIGAIFAWSMLAATVGTILRLIEENAGLLGKIVIGLIGVAWSIATFFVVPVIAYENAGPIEAFKRSSGIVREKWGESLAGNFSLGLVQLIGVLAAIVIAFIIGSTISVIAGIVLGLLCILLVAAVISAAQTVFIAAVYHNVKGNPTEQFNQQLIDNLFTQKD